MDERLTPEELARCDGREGRPAYVAFEGTVYDVSGSRMWRSGTHMRRHEAGHDLTAELAAAPHGPEVFLREGITRVGTLAQVREERGPAWLGSLLDRFPMLARHPHPMLVHFPMAYPIAASMFTALSLTHWAPSLFEQIAFAMLVLGLASTPLAMLSGFFTWWLNYRARMVHHVRCKMVCSTVLLVVQTICLILRLQRPAPLPRSPVFIALMLVLAPLALLLGYHGGQLTFPYVHRHRTR